METTELNKFIFSDLVRAEAHRQWVKDHNDLVRNGLPDDKIKEIMKHQDSYIPSAIQRLNELNLSVFEALAESRKESLI